MPLLNIVGVTGMNNTIHIAQVFMVGETAPDYEWALQHLVQLQSKFGIPLHQVVLVDRDLALLNALETIYPRVPVLLCIWYIMKDVQAHARRRTFMREIDPETNQLRDSAAHEAFCEALVRLINAPTDDEFNFRRRELYLLSSEEAAYIDDVWLDIWKRGIVRCWTDSIVHFGMHATSRVEGYHATMKAWLGSSRGDFLTVHNRMEHWWRQTINKHHKLVSDAEIVLPTRLQASFYADVAKVIHAHTLTKCCSAYRRIDVLM
ncbi:hypothetical protein PR003_g3353 [Phytophthora rubi]|uniref:MULE transposase domain-containing protein n=1 Tax=Phytophthora rubi TaxID=129364 RepID=A0A6A4FQC6_9STRA|nr:hypothetical protein PR001_g3424 [Phytophthora rubi]KAE9354461.1 hypothetical protein PR003_g3353 [Phytophthora rubi]